MTTPRAANLPDVKQTVVRLLRWLREHGHTDLSSADDYVTAVLEDGNAHAPRSIPAIVSEATVLAYGTHVRTAVPAARRAVSALRMAQTHTKTLAAALTQFDREMASRGGGRSEPPVGDLGTRAVAVLARVEDRLGSFGTQRRYPTSLAAWRKFTGNVCVALVRAGMPLGEAASFFPEEGVDPAAIRERLRKRAERRRVRVARGTSKKILGRKG